MHDSTRYCRAANLRSRMPRKVPHGYSRHANIDHASPSRKRYAKAKRGACLPIAGYSQRCFARRSLSRRPRSVMDAAGPSSVERSCIHARGEDLAVFRSRWPPIPRCASDTRREFITKLARRTRFWPDKSVMANFSSRMPLKRCFNPPLALQVRRLRQIGWSVRRRVTLSSSRRRWEGLAQQGRCLVNVGQYCFVGSRHPILGTQTTRCADLGGGRGNENMKIRAFLTAGLIIAGVTGPSFAFEGMLLSGNGGIHADRLLQAVSCNVNDDDKQALCMRGCEDEYIKASQAYGTAGHLEGPKEAKKACETKCGC